jgi:RNA polymerase sigma-70 factor (ECF subfamily)
MRRRAVRVGERGDYESVFRATFAPVTRTVYLIVHDRAVAEEITQDAFLKLLQKWSTVADYERPEAWVRKVAVRMAIRHVGRERSRAGRELKAQPSQPHQPPDPDPDVMRAVRQLAPMQRAVVVLFYWEDRPVAEIAHTLEVSDSTVKQHLHRARARLAQALGEEVGTDVR